MERNVILLIKRRRENGIGMRSGSRSTTVLCHGATKEFAWKKADEFITYPPVVFKGSRAEAERLAQEKIEELIKEDGGKYRYGLREEMRKFWE